MDSNEPSNQTPTTADLVKDCVNNNDDDINSSKDIIGHAGSSQRGDKLDNTDRSEERNRKNEALGKNLIGQTNLESNEFSQTNNDQIVIGQTNLSSAQHLPQGYQPRFTTPLPKQQIEQDPNQTQLDPVELTNKLNDLKVSDAVEAYETSAETNSDKSGNLPDLVSSIEKKSSSTQASVEDDSIPSYQVKWIKFRNKQCAIIMQNVNGCCPLLGIMNVLLLRGKIQLPLSTKIVTYDQMIVFLANFILENGTNSAPEGFQLDYEQNINDAMQLFPKLQTGLDVNVQFNSITSFEYTSEMIIFDLLGISLYHGWIVDQDDIETVSVIGSCSYNQLVDKIITNKSSNKSEEVSEALIAERFLESTASQLTYYGLSELVSNVREQELSILFRNNHFITLYKNQNQLYQLVTDQGFLHEPDVVWETLTHIDNDDQFVNHEFKPSSAKSNTLSPNEEKKQIDQDYLIALSIEEEEKKNAANQAMVEGVDCDNEMRNYNIMNDEDLARKLQEEEDLKAEELERNRNSKLVKHYYDKKLVTSSSLNPRSYQRANHRDHYHQNELDHPSQMNHPHQINVSRVNEASPSNDDYIRNRRSNTPQHSSSENHTQSSGSSNRESHHSRNHSNHGYHNSSKNKCIIS